MGLKSFSLAIFLRLGRLLQSNHYGIEIGSRENKLHGVWYSCNRTIMGLKWMIVFVGGYQPDMLQSNHYGIEIEVYAEKLGLIEKSCNRTIMGLKSSIPSLKVPVRVRVAIEPLWDWNVAPVISGPGGLFGCNRTIMGLKLSYPELQRRKPT